MPNFPVPVTALYAGLLGILALVLAARVGARRARLKIDIGDGGNPEMLRAIRVHGNFVEYVPLALVLIALVEANGAPVWTLHVLGLTLVLGRLLHAYGLATEPGESLGRVVGTVASFLVIAASSLGAIWQFVER